MAKLTRITGKVFGSAATATIGGIGQFGSAKTGTPNLTTDVATIQGLQAYLNGWGSAVITSRNFPPIEEVTGVLKTISYQTCYTLQEGIPEYDINTEYSNTSLVKSVNNGIVTLYVSLVSNNIGNPLSDSSKWKPYILDKIQRNIGEIVTSTIPLTDADLHLLDGSLLSGSGIYGGFVTYIAGLVTDYPDLFTTELLWQQTVSNYGVCGKFVYDSNNNTVRLPKITGFTEGTTDANALGDLVQAGLPNITGEFNTYQAGLDTIANGAFQGTNYPIYNWNTVAGATQKDMHYSFNASRSSSIYGNSNTVQPQAIKVLYYIVIATSTKTDIQVDIDEIATDLNGKADTDLSNCVSGAFESVVALAQSTGKNTVMSWNAPDWASAETKTVNTTYTATSNGYFITSGYAAGGNPTMIIYVNGTERMRVGYHGGGGSSYTIPLICPISKGDTYSVSWANSAYFVSVKGA